MAKKDTLEDIASKVGSIENDIPKLWNALNTIAERLGISLKDDGEYFMESDNPDVPKLGLQSGGGSVAVPAPAQSMDVSTFAKEVLAEFKKDPPRVNLGNQSVPIDVESLISGNKALFKRISLPWDNWFIKHRTDMLRLHGWKEVHVGDDVVLAVDEHPQIPPNPFLDNAPSEPTEPAKKPVKKTRFKSPFWNVTFAIVTSRIFGYFVTVIAVLLALNEHQQTQKYEDEAKRYEDAAKRYMIYRTIFQSYPEDRKIYEDCDADIARFGTDKVLEHVLKRDREIKQQQLRDKR